MDITNLLESVTGTVREASTLMNKPFEVTHKGNLSNIVTTNDRIVQECLKTRLQDLLPDSGFLCEEDDFNYVRKNTWIIDPIDGTANYSRGIDFCAISVALVQEGKTLMGVVYLPFKDEMFTSIVGKGAYCNHKRINVSRRTFDDSIFCSSLCAYHKENMALCSKIINETFLQCNDVRRFGSAATELCYIAMGRCELFFEYELSPWDYASASLILREAGGYLTDIHGKALDYDHNTGIIAANNMANLKHLGNIVAKYVK